MGPAVIAAARLPGHLIAIDVLEQTALIVRKDSTATSVADLKGKMVAFPGEGSQQYPLLLKALKDAGMSATDVKLFKANAPNIGQLVMQKDVDAGTIWDPHVSNALASGKAKVLLKAERIVPIKEGHYVGNGTYVRSDFMKKRPELVQDVVNAIVAGIDFINAEPKKAVAIWSKEIGFPAEVIDYSLSILGTPVKPPEAHRGDQQQQSLLARYGSRLRRIWAEAFDALPAFVASWDYDQRPESLREDRQRIRSTRCGWKALSLETC